MTSIFSRTERSTDFTEKYFPCVDATEEFPFLGGKNNQGVNPVNVFNSVMTGAKEVVRVCNCADSV